MPRDREVDVACEERERKTSTRKTLLFVWKKTLLLFNPSFDREESVVRVPDPSIVLRMNSLTGASRGREKRRKGGKGRVAE